MGVLDQKEFHTTPKSAQSRAGSKRGIEETGLVTQPKKTKPSAISPHLGEDYVKHMGTFREKDDAGKSERRRTRQPDKK